MRSRALLHLQVDRAAVCALRDPSISIDAKGPAIADVYTGGYMQVWEQWVCSGAFILGGHGPAV